MGHIPVLLHETIALLDPKLGNVAVDCTFNRAGHSTLLAERIGPSGTLVGFDLDHVALLEGRGVLEKNVAEKPKIILCETNFRHIKNVLKENAISEVDVLMADLGLSSQELDESGRGFSFQKEEPLQMTLSSRDGQLITAYDVVNSWSQETLQEIIRSFSDEAFAGRIARNIVESRNTKAITTTKQLADIIYHSVPSFYKRGRIHPATKTFQAIRMAVNDEVGALQELLSSLPAILKKNGKVAFISFHSIEDRLVKNYFKDNASHWSVVTKKPITPTEEELKNNPRSRSAKLRVYQKL